MQRLRGRVFGDTARRCTPQHGLNPRREFPWIERFGQVVIGADFQTEDAVYLIAARREHDDRHARFGADFLQDFEAACTGQHHVQDQKRVIFREGLFKAQGPTVHGVHPEAFRLEKFRDEFAEFDVVINDEDARRGTIVGRGRLLLHEFSRAVLARGILHRCPILHSRKEVPVGR